MRCHRPTLQTAGQSSATLWDSPGDAVMPTRCHWRRAARCSPGTPRSRGVGGMHPLELSGGSEPPHEQSAGCACSTPRRDPGLHTLLGPQLEGTLCVCGLGVPPVRQQHGTAMQHAAHRRAPHRSAATRCTRGCSSVQHPDVQMCTAVVPARLHAVLHITARAPRASPALHPTPRPTAAP